MSELLPKTIRDAVELADPDDLVLYEPVFSGGYQLKPGMMALVTEHEAALAKIESDHQAYIASASKSIIEHSARLAMYDAGVPVPLLRAAAAVFQGETKLKVVKSATGENGLDVVVDGQHFADLPFAASTWLDTSESGKVFRERSGRGKRGAHGPASAAIARLRQ